MTRITRNKPTTEHASGLTIRSADLARARPFRWAWNQRVLMNYINLQIGEEGVGKGNLTAWQAARISRGELDGDLKGEPRKVVFVGDEDSWDHIWVPRLKAAGADLTMVQYIEAGLNGTIDVRKDAEALREYIEAERVALVYFDQLLDNLGYTDSWKDKDVRDALAPLRSVVQQTDSALLASMHPNKRQGSFRDRISGTPAFNALSRSSLLVAEHPTESDRTVVVRGKGNYSIEPPAFEFRIEEHLLTVEGREITTSRITDVRETGLQVGDLLEAKTSRRRPESIAGQARTALEAMFNDGRARIAGAVLEQMDAEGFPERTVQQARRDLEILTWKDGFQGPQMWGYDKPKIKVKTKRPPS
jgi:hypothetical protein